MNLTPHPSPLPIIRARMDHSWLYAYTNGGSLASAVFLHAPHLAFWLDCFFCLCVAAENPNTPLLRAMVLRAASANGSASVVRRCLAMFDDDVSSIPADLRQLVYNTVAAEGGEARWQRLRSMMKVAASSEEQRRLIAALGRASSPALLASALDMMLGEGLFLASPRCRR